MRFPFAVCVFICIAVVTAPLLAQSPNGNINGLVSDQTNAAVAGADIVAVNDVTRVQYTAKTNNEGIYGLTNLPPGPYRIQVSKIGFKTLIKPDIVLNVQDSLSINFTLLVGAFHEIVTVEGGTPLVNTENASVSTVVDRQFADNLPMNGRSFQTLIQLTPGVVLTPTTNFYDSGQFSINGQRASSNYWMVDGVSANVGLSSFIIPGNGLGGAIGSFSAQGGTNSLVSTDAMQEFRIQTSTYAPEYGRTPGGQISIVTRSGTNQFHGTLFDYLRNDAFDANDWFANNKGLPKAAERQNDFGGTFEGPLRRERTFFFFSYEGLRLRLPQTALTAVPDLSARQSADPTVQPFLNAFPLPNGAELGNGAAEFNSSFSNSASLDAYSLRVDHKLSPGVSLFGRYNYSPSATVQRGNGEALSTVSPAKITLQTATLGAAWAISSVAANDLRFNYSRTNSRNSLYLDSFGGAVPLQSIPFPDPYTVRDAVFNLSIFSLPGGGYAVGQNTQNLQQQVNVVDGFSFLHGAHNLKFGIDYRRLSPQYRPRPYSQIAAFANVASASAGDLLFSVVPVYSPATFLFRNFGLYAQDTFRANPRLSLTYGLRWDIDFAPKTISGPLPPAVTGFNLRNLSGLTLAPVGTPAFRTPYGNIAPRVGVAYQANQTPGWNTIVRGGAGIFFDLATSEAGNLFGFGAYPYGASKINFGGKFPLDSSSAAAPPIAPPSGGSGTVTAFAPDLQLPYTVQWNVALEQSLGKDQSLSVSYVGASGKRLLESAYVSSPNANYGAAYLVGNWGTSSYNALQLQFRRRMSHGLDVLASYVWSHAIDTASAGSLGTLSNALVPSEGVESNRGNADFDVRSSFSAGVSYEIPGAYHGAAHSILGGWSVQSILQARTALPLTVYDSRFSQLFNGTAEVRADAVPNLPLYVYDSNLPGGKALNPAAFIDPPVDSNGSPTRQGNVGRNSLRGFGALQWDFAIHREFPIHDRLRLQYRAEFFNILNHPNFGNPVADISKSSQFGRSTQMLGRSLSGSSVGGGGFDALYQIGGPRSIQFALKLKF